MDVWIGESEVGLIEQTFRAFGTEETGIGVETVWRAFYFNRFSGRYTFLCDCATEGEARQAIIDHAEEQERHGQD